MGIEVQTWDYRLARAEYQHQQSCDPAYRQLKREILATFIPINAKPLRDTAAQFGGLM